MYYATSLLTDKKKDILTETANHYKDLYSQKDTDSVDLSAIINNENFTKLTNGESLILDQPLQYGEYLPSLKKMSNHSSPGSSGFTIAFHEKNLDCHCPLLSKVFN